MVASGRLPSQSSFEYDWTCSAGSVEAVSKSVFAGLWFTCIITLRRSKLLRVLSSPTFNGQPCGGFGPYESAVAQQSNILTPHNLFFQSRKEVYVYLKNNRNPMPKVCVVSHLYKYKPSKLSGFIECHFLSPFLPVLVHVKFVHIASEKESPTSILALLPVPTLKTGDVPNAH